MKLKKIKITPEIKLYYSDQKPDWDLVNKASRIFFGSIEPFKTKHRHQVYMLEHNNEVYYVKKFSPPTFEQELSYRFRESKADNCLNISNQLRKANFKVVESIFVLNYQKKWKHESLFVTKKTEGISLDDFFSSDVDNCEKKDVMSCLVSTLGVFYKNGFLHYDPVLINFFIDPNQKPYEIIFLDFDSISYNRRISTKRTFDVLSKFCYFCYGFLESQNIGKLYSYDKVIFYLDIFLRSYNPKIKVDEAYKYLTQGTIKLLKRKGKLSVNNKVNILKLIDLNASKL